MSDEYGCYTVGWAMSCGCTDKVKCRDHANDKVNHPFHYTRGKIETIDLIEEIVQHYSDPVIGGSIWQVIKYVSRAPFKGNLSEDLEKARWYLDRAISHAKKIEGATKGLESD